MSKFKCCVCGNRFDDDYEECHEFTKHNKNGKPLTSRGLACESCYDDAVCSCDTCDEQYSEGNFYCACGTREVGKFVLRSYHDSASPHFHGDDKVRFGLEMEVQGGFRRQAVALSAAGFSEKDMYAEEDCTVDVEWITRPLLPSEAPEFIRRAVTALRKGGAVVDDDSCGCHHNVDRHALTDEGWGKVCIAVHAFYDKLLKYSGESREAHDFAKEVPGIYEYTNATLAYTLCSENAHNCVAFHKSGVVELRLPGMTMDAEAMVTQFKLYHNLVVNAKQASMNPRNFLSSFGPLDDGMAASLKKVGFKYTLDPPAPVVIIPAPARKGFCDIRVGDTVKLLDSQGVYKVHGIPPGMHDHMLPDRSVNSSKRNCTGSHMVVGIRHPEGSPLPAQDRVILYNQGWYYAGQLSVVTSGDGSELYGKTSGQAAGTMAFIPPQPHESYVDPAARAPQPARAVAVAQPPTRRRRVCA